MWSWFYGFLKRFVGFVVTVTTGAMAFSWLYGYDEEVRALASEHRLLVTIGLVLSGIIFAMYDWLNTHEP